MSTPKIISKPRIRQPNENGGWSPSFAVEEDGARRVLRVVDWFGGYFDKPASGQYIGPSGFVSTAAEAVDIRGEDGAGGGGGTDDQTAAEVPFTPAGALSSTNVQAALAELDSEKQPIAAVLTGTTASFTAAQETKLGHITVTQAVDLDTLESDTAANNAKVTNATHTGDVTGDVALTIAADAVTNTKLANMAEATLKGRPAASGTGDPVDLTATQARTILNVADGATANASDAALRDRATHTGTQATSTITGLDGTLAAASSLIFTNAANIAANTAAIAGKADTAHTHAIADVTGLQAALDAKAALPTLSIRRWVFSDFHDTTALRNLPFIGAAIASGTGLTSVTVGDGFGVLRIASSASANSGYRFQSLSGIQGRTGLFFRGIIGWTGVDFDAGGIVVRMGFHDSTSSAEPTDGIYMQAAGDQVVLRCAAASSRTSSSTAWTVPALNTLYIVEIEQTSSTTAVIAIFDLSGALLFTETVASNVPSGTGQIFVAGLTAHRVSAGARNIALVDYMGFGPVREPYA